MRGENAGQWKDFATGQAGDVLDLIGSVLNLNMKEVMSWAQKDTASEMIFRKLFDPQADERKTMD